MTTAEPGAALACGALVDDLLAQVAAGLGAARDAHQRACRFCRDVLAELIRLWAPIDELASAAVAVPQELVDRALARVRAADDPAGHARVEDGGGSFLVARRAVASVAGHAARATDGVRMALGAVVEPGPVLELTVAAEYGQDLHALADRLRARVGAEVSALTGLEPTRIAVTIDDVLPAPARSGAERL